MTKTTLFIIYCLLFVFGILLGTFLKLNFNAFYIFLLCLINLILSIIFWPTKYNLFFLGLTFLFLGWWRYQISLPELNPSNLIYYTRQPVELIGQIVKEPDIRDSYRQLTLGKILQLPEKRALAGKLLLNLPNYPPYTYGDWLKISCQLELPANFNDFNYKNYLASRGVYVLCRRPLKVEKLKINQLSLVQRLYRQLLKFKYNFKRVIDLTIAYPQNEVLSAMVLGLRRNIPLNILNSFKASGLAHIIAISGLHISIITLWLMNFFIAIGFQRRPAFYLSAFSLCLFLLMIGFRASSLRAGIMGFSVLLAMQLGRLNKSINVLLLAACVLLLINPQLLLGDIGFQLSFLAVAGIIYLGELINHWLSKIKVPEFFEIRSSLMMTLSAQFMVLPLIIYYFGNLSLVAPLANLLVLPLLPLVIILGLILGLLGFVFLPAAKLLGLVLTLLIKWIIYISQLLSRLPYGNFVIVNFNLFWLLVIYLCLAVLFWFYRFKLKTKL